MNGARPKLSVPHRSLRQQPLHVLAIVAAVATLPALGYFWAPFLSQDEALLVLYPEMILSGRLPHRDFFTVSAPAATPSSRRCSRRSALPSWPSAQSGSSTTSSCRQALLPRRGRMGCGPVAWREPQRRSSCPAGHTAYAWLGGLALAVWALAVIAADTSGRSHVIAGCLAGLAAAWRFEMIVLAAACLPLVARDRRAAAFSLGLLTGLMPTMWHLAIAGKQVFENVVLGRLTIDGGLGVPATATAKTALAVCFVAAVAASCAAWRSRSPVSMSLALVNLLVLPQAVQRIDLIHVLFCACVLWPFSSVVISARLKPSEDSAGASGHRLGARRSPNPVRRPEHDRAVRNRACKLGHVDEHGTGPVWRPQPPSDAPIPRGSFRRSLRLSNG